jgi:DNA-binding MarR family transcriptional regulator
MNEPSTNAIADEAVQAYLALGDAIRVAILPEWIVTDFTISQLKALMLLEYHGELAVSELGKLLHLSNPAASILVQQIVDQNMVERSEDSRDRRRTLVRMTAKGSELIIGRHRQTEEKLRRWLSQLSGDDLLAVARGLNTLASVARAEREQRNA